MRKTIIIAALVFFAFNSFAFGYWIWTPKTNKWVNPKYSVKDDPKKQFEYALQFYNSFKIKEAMAEFNNLINNFPKSVEAAEAQFYIGLCWEKEDKLFEAFTAYQKVVDKYPFSERTSEVLDKEYALGEKYLEKNTSSFWRNFAGEEHPAVVIFRAVINNVPYGKYADISQYKIGLVLKDIGRLQESKDEFQKVINEFPQSQWVQAAKYQIAVLDAQIAPDPEYSQESTATAVKGFEEFVRQYPEAELSDKARKEIKALKEKEAKNNFNIAKFYEKQKAYDSAKIYYRQVFQNYPDSALAKQARQDYDALEAKQ